MRIAQNYAETLPFQKNSTPGNKVKLRYFTKLINAYSFLDLLFLVQNSTRYKIVIEKMTPIPYRMKLSKS